MKLSGKLATALLIGVQTNAPVGTSLAQSLDIKNVDVYEVSSGTVRSDQNVQIRDGMITRIGASSSTELSGDVSSISGEGLTLVPGLTDAHVHMNEIDVGTFLANGVTSVRELNGSPDHLELRDRIASGHVSGPRMLVSSPLLVGEPIRFRHIEVKAPSQAKALVEEFSEAGYDYIKIYDGIAEDVYLELASAANTFGLEMTGHIPSAVGLKGILSAGQSIEHNEKIVADVLGHDFSNTQRLRTAAIDIARSGVAVTPTLAVHEFLSDRQSPDVQARLASDNLRYVDQDIVDWWKSMFPMRRVNGASTQNPGALDFLNAQRILLLEMHTLGIPILAGTDTPNALMVAGFSLHDELDSLVRAGLSNVDAIRAATLTPGREMPWPVQIGEVKTGFAADLLLVAGNPADDLSVLRKPVGVIANGVWLDRNQLDLLLAGASRE